MTLHVYTSRISYGGPDRLDVTRKGNDPFGVTFAPSWELLRRGTAARGRAKRMVDDGREKEGCFAAVMAWDDYRCHYIAEMRQRYRTHRDKWDRLLKRERVVLCCYCVVPKMCHRTVLAELLVKLGAVYEEEIVQ